MHNVVLILGFCIAVISANNFVSNALGSNMVLQRAPQKANLWGWSKTPGSTVSVSLTNGKSYHTTAANDGFWAVLLDPVQAGGPYKIAISSTAGESSVLTNILFGDVFVCGGQSNMQMTVDSVFNASTEVKEADKYPNIRLFTVGQGTTSATPLLEFDTIEQTWSVASSATVGVGNWSAFSATCWFFGKNLYDHLQVPIGLFSDNWGGTPVQAWSSPDALKKCKATKTHAYGPDDDSQLWNAMIVPVLPMTIKGAAWYQGEANAGNSNYYACAFPAMIADWRAKWGGDTRNDFGFFYVQLAPWLASDNTVEALTRLSQLFANSLPNVGFATAADLGDPTSPFNSIHPRLKQEVGYRLSLSARAITYGEDIQYLGPQATSWKIINPNTVEVAFEDASVGEGLVSVPFTCDVNVPPVQCAQFELGTTAGWITAQGTISGKTTVRISANVGSSQIIGVRYGFSNYPIMSLQNNANLPAIPFAFPNPIQPSYY